MRQKEAMVLKPGHTIVATYMSRGTQPYPEEDNVTCSGTGNMMDYK